MQVKRLIVTGGLGFIGKNYCALEEKWNCDKVILDKVTYASDLDFYYEHLKPRGWRLLVADTSDLNSLPPDSFFCKSLILNFAAESHVDRSFSNAAVFLRSNALGTLNLVEKALKSSSRLLHISTDEVYGEILTDSVDESAVLNPTNPYSATKAAGDILVQTYIKCFGLQAKVIRANNIFGPRQLDEKVIPKAIHAALQGDIFYVHGTKDLRRSFLHSSDFAAALDIVLDSWQESEFNLFNVAGEVDVSIRELVERIYTFCGADLSLIKIGEDRPFNDGAYQINDQRLRQLGWKPRANFWVELKDLCISRSYLRRLDNF